MKEGKINVFPKKNKNSWYFIMIAQNHYKMTQITYLAQNLYDQVKMSKNTHLLDYGLSPFPVQNPYSKFILSI